MFNNPWIRRLIFLGVVGLLVILGSVFCQSMGYHQAGMGSPNSTVEGTLRAYGTENPDNIIAYFTPTYAALMQENLKSLFAATQGVSIQNISTMTVYQEGLAAHVQASWDMVTKVNGQTSTRHYSKLINLIKNTDGKWYINQII